jgi:hypothetical protein|nr:hypothetical protein [uncultured Devosia sp.]
MLENHFDPQLEELTDRSVGRLLVADVLDLQAFEALKDHIWGKAVGLKDEFCLSKQVLSSLRSAAHAIRSRAEYLPDARNHLGLANEFDEMLDRLVASEVRSYRQAGVPRII